MELQPLREQIHLDEQPSTAARQNENEFTETLPNDNLSEQCITCSRNLLCCLEAVWTASKIEYTYTQTKLHLIQERLNEHRLRLNIWISDCGVEAGNLPPSFLEDGTSLKLNHALTVLFEQLHNSLSVAFQNIISIQKNAQKARDQVSSDRALLPAIQKAEDNVLKACDDLTTTIYELAELQPVIQDAYVLMGRGTEAAFHQKVMNIRAQVAANRSSSVADIPNSSPVSEDTGSRNSIDEVCPRCSKNFPWHALAFHTELCEAVQKPLPTMKEEDQRDSHIDNNTTEVSEPNRPNYTRISRNNVSIETLKAHGLEYRSDEDPEYLLIEGRIPKSEQDLLWKHTSELRERRYGSTPMRVNISHETLTKKEGSNSGDPIQQITPPKGPPRHLAIGKDITNTAEDYSGEIDVPVARWLLFSSSEFRNRDDILFKMLPFEMKLTQQKLREIQYLRENPSEILGPLVKDIEDAIDYWRYSTKRGVRGQPTMMATRMPQMKREQSSNVKGTSGAEEICYASIIQVEKKPRPGVTGPAKIERIKVERIKISDILHSKKLLNIANENIMADLTYIHVPANNMSWVEDIIAVYYSEDLGTTNNQYKKPFSRYESRTSSGTVLSHEKWRGRERGDSSSRFMESGCLPSKETNAPIAIFMPFLHWVAPTFWEMAQSATNYTERRWRQGRQEFSVFKSGNDRTEFKIRSPLGNFLMLAANLYKRFMFAKDEALLVGYLYNKPPLHARRSLAQYSHQGPPFMTKFHTRLDSPKRVIVVDQLWMWILDESTVITSFWGEPTGHKHLSVYESIEREILKLSAYTMGINITAYGLANIIMNECSGALLDVPKFPNELSGVLEGYARNLGYISRTFDEHQIILEDKILDSNGDKSVRQMFHEIYAIMQELESMLDVFREQERVFKQFAGQNGGWGSSLHDLNNRQELLEDLRGEGKHLIFKMEQYNALNLNRVAMIEAKASLRTATSAENQQRSLTTLTVASLIFLPLIYLTLTVHVTEVADLRIILPVAYVVFVFGMVLGFSETFHAAISFYKKLIGESSTNHSSLSYTKMKIEAAEARLIEKRRLESYKTAQRLSENKRLKVKRKPVTGSMV